MQRVYNNNAPAIGLKHKILNCSCNCRHSQVDCQALRSVYHRPPHAAFYHMLVVCYSFHSVMAHLHQRANTRTSSSQSSRPNSSCIIMHGFLWKPSTPRPRARRVEKSFAKCHENSSEYSFKSF